MCFTGFAHAKLHSSLGESVFDYNVEVKIEEESHYSPGIESYSLTQR
jgi:hypothetical protein